MERCRLTFQPSLITSVSRQGEVLLHRSNSTRIDVYKYEDISGTFSEMRQVDSPVDISSDNWCRLYIYDSQDATVAIKKHDFYSPTVLVSLGEKLQEWLQDGFQIGCWSNKRRLYKLQKDARTGWEVCIFDQNSTVSHYLRPPPTHAWDSKLISACEEEATGNKAVCHAPRRPKENTLEIFNSEGKSHNIKKVKRIAKYVGCRIMGDISYFSVRLLDHLFHFPFTLYTEEIHY